MQFRPVNNPAPLAGQPPSFDTYEAQAAWRLKCERALASTGPRWIVLPDCRLHSAFGDVLLNAGDTVEPHVHFSPEQILTLEARGVIGRGSPEGQLVEETLRSARFVVAEGNSVTSVAPFGIRPAGSEIRAEWLSGGSAALAELLKRGTVVDRHAHLQPGYLARRERETALELAKAELERAAAQLGEDDSQKVQAAYFRARDAVEIATQRLAYAPLAGGGTK